MTRRILDTQVFAERRATLDRLAGTDPARWFEEALAASANGGSIFDANLARRRLVGLVWRVVFIHPPAWKTAPDLDPRRLFRRLVDARRRHDGEAIRSLLDDLKRAGCLVQFAEPREGRQAHQ